MRSGKHVDYDQLARNYDRRFAQEKVRATAVALSTLARDLTARRILEVGCGTGRWLADLLPEWEQLYGLDLSSAMLLKAKERDAQLQVVRGRAGRLPFPTASFDLVFCVNAIHHFVEQRGFVLEARRLLNSGGALAVVGMDPHDRRDHWYVYDYFNGTYETDLERFPTWGDLVNWMAAAGFGQITWRIVERINDPKVGWDVLDDPFLRKESTYQLVLLTDDAYAEGVRRIREALTAADKVGEQLVFRSDILMGMVVGWL